MNNQTLEHFEKRDCDLISLRKRVRPLKKYVPIAYKSRIIQFKGFIFALLFSIAIISLSSCTDPVEVALKTADADKGITAVNKLTDSTTLARVAIEAKTYQVQEAAAKKLEDPALLAKVAIWVHSSGIGRVAVEKLEDPALLAKVAIEWVHSSEIGRVAVENLEDPALLAKVAIERNCEKAVEKLTDPALLAKVVIEGNCEKAVEKLLADPALLASLANINGDRRVQIFYKLIPVFDIIPQEHKSRLILHILPAILLLSDPDFVNIVGEIVSIKIDWSPTSARYVGGGIRSGESFNCTIKLKNLSRPLSHLWSTIFPGRASSFVFYSARIDVADLLEPVFEKLPHPLLSRIVKESNNNYLRRAAHNRLVGHFQH